MAQRKPIEIGRPVGEKEIRYERLEQESIGVLLAYFDGADDPLKAKIAASVLSTVARHEATESAKARTQVIIGWHLYRDPERFGEYLKVAMPDVPQLASGT